MRIAAVVMGVALLGGGGAALAQDLTSEAATKFYSSCRTNQQGSPTECSCAVGYFAGAMKDDEFIMMAELSRFIDKVGGIPDPDGAQAAAQVQRTKMGMSETRFMEVMQAFVTVGDRASTYSDRICMPLANKTQ